MGGNPGIQHAYQQRHLSAKAADWRNTVSWGAEASDDASPEMPSASKASLWLKADLLAYADKVGVASTGTKGEIVDRLISAGYLIR